MTYDLVVHNGLVVTVNPDFDIFENGMVCIKDGRIERVDPHTDKPVLPDAATHMDAGGGIVMPGLVNTHTHLPMTIFRGLADDLPLDVWLNEHIFPAEGKYINPENVYLGASLGCAELLLSGTITCCDGYFLEDRVARAALDAGIRAVVGQGVIDFPAPGVSDPAKNIQAARRFVEQWQGKSALLAPSIFCHSPYLCSENTLKKAKAAADECGVLFQIHAAETQDEARKIPQTGDRSVVTYLDRIGILDGNTLLVHAVWVDETDIDIIAQSGARISHNPESNMKLAAGIAPLPAFLKAGIPVGLGTDGCASNNNMDLFQEMDTAAKLHKVSTLDPTATDARSILKMATIDGAHAIGLGDKIGSLEYGKQADLIILDIQKPHLTPMHNPVSQLVYAASGADVVDVIVSGKVVVEKRRILTLDVESILDKVTELGKKIRAENAKSH